MSLSQNLINQFVKVVNYGKKENKEATVNAVYKQIDGVKYVQIDGSDIWTPVTAMVEVEDGDRVEVSIKNHTAIITGNITNPSAGSSSVQDIKDTVDEHGNTIKQINNSIEQQDNSIIQINNSLKQVENTILQFDNTINQQNNKIQQFENTINQQGDTITSMNNTITQQGNDIESINNTVIAQGNSIIQHDNAIKQQDNIIAQQGNIITQQGTTLETFNSQIKILNSGFKIEDGVLTGLSEIIINKLKTDNLDATYANIDFTNINFAAVQKIFSESGIIKDLIVDKGNITGELVGVTIKGDLIEANTLQADKLVIKGEDGLYYKLNIDSLGETTASSDEKYQNGLDGSVIIANSITAEKVNVGDLVAFDATIGGFNISEDAIYSGVKSSVDNTTRGTYMDKNGQFAIGDASNFIKYFYDPTKKIYKLEISAGSIKMGGSSETIQEIVDGTVKTVKVLYALSNSETEPPTTGWSEAAPEWQNDKYMWQKTQMIHVDGNTTESEPTCIQGAKGQDGQSGTPGRDGASITIISTSITYQVSTSGTTKPTGNWSTDIPSIPNGQYLWTKTTVLYSDETETESYSVSYKGTNGTNGKDGADGTNGKDGNGIKSITYYYKNTTTQTSPDPSTITSTTIPVLSPTNKYLWQKEVIEFSDSSIPDKITVSLLAVYGNTGSKGDTGADGKGIKSSEVTYQSSTSGTVIPTGTWNVDIPSVDAGSYLWTKTVITYTDNSTSDPAYSVSKMGNTGATGAAGKDGADGKGIKNSEITYQISTSGTKIPTGSWSLTIPKTTLDKPYLWTKTVITYTDDTTSDPVYSIGSTLEGVMVGGRNLLLGTKDPTYDHFTHLYTQTDQTFLSATVRKTSGIWQGIKFDFFKEIESRGLAKAGDTFTYSIWAKTDEPDKSIKADVTISCVVNGKNFNMVPTQDAKSEDGSAIITSEWKKFYWTFTIPSDDYLSPNGKIFGTRIEQNTNNTTGYYVYWAAPKLEYGNKPTDWSQAPEDVDSDIQNIANIASDALTKSNGAYTEIDSLKSTINNMVKDDNHMVSIEQSASGGIQINMTQITNEINSMLEDLKDKISSKEASDLRDDLNTAISNVELRTAYINAFQDENGNPYIILGAEDSPFQVRITNTSIDFLQNGDVIAYANGQAFFNLRTVVQQDVQIGLGPGYIFKTRESGNMGLTYVNG